MGWVLLVTVKTAHFMQCRVKFHKPLTCLSTAPGGKDHAVVYISVSCEVSIFSYTAIASTSGIY